MEVVIHRKFEYEPANKRRNNIPVVLLFRLHRMIQELNSYFMTYKLIGFIFIKLHKLTFVLVLTFYCITFYVL